jgi:hypothetical protein
VGVVDAVEAEGGDAIGIGIAGAPVVVVVTGAEERVDRAITATSERRGRAAEGLGVSASRRRFATW